MKQFKAFVDLLEKVQLYAGLGTVAGISIIVPTDVFFRYVLNSPLMWPQDAATGLMVWLAFLGASVLYKRRGHVAVMFLARYFPHTTGVVLSLAIDAMIAFLYVFIIVYGYGLNKIQMMSDTVGLGIPRGFSYSLPLLVNISIMFIYSLYFLCKRSTTEEE